VLGIVSTELCRRLGFKWNVFLSIPCPCLLLNPRHFSRSWGRNKGPKPVSKRVEFEQECPGFLKIRLDLVKVVERITGMVFLIGPTRSRHTCEAVRVDSTGIPPNHGTVTFTKKDPRSSMRRVHEVHPYTCLLSFWSLYNYSCGPYAWRFLLARREGHAPRATLGRKSIVHVLFVLLLLLQIGRSAWTRLCGASRLMGGVNDAQISPL
jgi:hypothetical protein